MLTSFQHWLTENPLYQILLAALICPPIAWALKFLWQFLKIRPQRIGNWILKTRIASARLNLRLVERTLNETPYLIYRCFVCLFALIVGCCFTILFCAIDEIDSLDKIERFLAVRFMSGVHIPPRPPWIASTMMLFSAAAVSLSFLRCFQMIARISVLMHDPEGLLESMRGRVTRLENRLPADEQSK